MDSHPSFHVLYANKIISFTDDHPKLNLTPEEKRLYGQLFKEADPNNTGFITGMAQTPEAALFDRRRR